MLKLIIGVELLLITNTVGRADDMMGCRFGDSSSCNSIIQGQPLWLVSAHDRMTVTNSLIHKYDIKNSGFGRTGPINYLLSDRSANFVTSCAGEDGTQEGDRDYQETGGSTQESLRM